MHRGKELRRNEQLASSVPKKDELRAQVPEANFSGRNVTKRCGTWAPQAWVSHLWNGTVVPHRLALTELVWGSDGVPGYSSACFTQESAQTLTTPILLCIIRAYVYMFTIIIRKLNILWVTHAYPFTPCSLFLSKLQTRHGEHTSQQLCFPYPRHEF